MARSLSSPREQLKLNQRVMLWLYPRLRELPLHAWEVALRRARDTDFLTGEWIGIVGGVGLVAWLLGAVDVTTPMASRFFAHVLQFVLALPLLSVVVGPFYVRRTRRGLDRELTSRAPGTGAPPHDRSES